MWHDPGRVGARLWTTAVAVALVAALLVPTASAEEPGTPGRIAYVDVLDGYALKMWEPSAAVAQPRNPGAGITTLVSKTYIPPAPQIPSVGQPSAPVWSPDGTRIAYTASVPQGGGIPGYHTAIFVYDLRTGVSTNVSNPFDSAKDPDPNDDILLGHEAVDYAPAWNHDGTEIGFIREVGAGRDDEKYAARGVNEWWVPATGGTGTQGTHATDLPAVIALAHVPGTDDLLSVIGDETGAHFALLGVHGGTPQKLSDAPMDGVLDYDVAPDGQSFVYSEPKTGGFVTQRASIADGHVITNYGTQQTALVRDSNTGNGPLHTGCLTLTSHPAGTTYQRCGLLERNDDNQQRDYRADEPDRLSLPWVQFGGASSGLSSFRSLFDVQAQQLPVFFLPGFLGSVITCGSSSEWPKLPRADLLGMQLDASGTQNVGCGASAPTGDAVDSVLGTNIYANDINFMQVNFPPHRGTVFGWDWRKEPQQTEPLLDAKIDDVLQQEPFKSEGVKRVVLYGHSYGGLLIRTYLKDHPEKVARVLTAGTPYWGSPKAIFPLALGVETPEGGPGLDLLLNNDDLKTFARTLAGVFQLFPSDNFGSWLQVGGAFQDAGGVRAFVDRLGGSTTLFDAAQQHHRDTYDGFYDDGQAIDVRAVVGTGLPTFGHIDFEPQADGTAIVHVDWVDGDGTVPGKSATQGELGTETPLGDPIHVQYRCGVAHVPLPGDGMVLDAYRDFLDHGATPKKLEKPCGFSGGALELDALPLGSASTGTSVFARAAGAPTARGTLMAQSTAPLSLDDAFAGGHIELLRTGVQTLVATNDRDPVTLAIPLDGTSFTYTSIGDSGPGTTYRYGPITGTAEIAPGGSPGALPVVTAGGRAVDPVPVASGGGGGGQPGGGSPAPGARPPGGSAGTGLGGSGGSPTALPGAPRVVLRRIRRSGAHLLVTVSCPARRGACAGTVALTTSAKGKPAASVRLKLAAGHHATLRLTLPRAVRTSLAHRHEVVLRVIATTRATAHAPTTVARRITLAP